MKLFIYYSMTGSGEVVAKYLETNNVDLRKVEPKKKLPKSFFWSVLSGGMLAGFNHKSKLKEFNYDLSGYDDIIIGSPIWNGKLSCPINTIFKNLDLTAKNVSFVLCSGSGEGPKAVKKINKKYPNAKIVILKEPKKHEEELKKLSYVL